MVETINPYQSPRFASPRPLTEDRPWTNAVRVERVEQGFLYRRVLFEAPLEADLEYSGYNVFDTVRIDGQLAAKKIGVWWFVPRFEFELASQGRRVPMVVEVRVSVWFLRIRAFRIQIDGLTVYSEGRWKDAPHSQ